MSTQAREPASLSALAPKWENLSAVEPKSITPVEVPIQAGLFANEYYFHVSLGAELKLGQD